MKKKAGKQLRQLKNITEEKIKEITAKIRAADLGIQNTSRLKQEKEEQNAYKKIHSQANSSTHMQGKNQDTGTQ